MLHLSWALHHWWEAVGAELRKKKPHRPFSPHNIYRVNCSQCMLCQFNYCPHPSDILSILSVLNVPLPSFSCFSVAWEDNLLDDLLNFAATPKGLLLLQRTGAINECVTFMFSQYAKKPQVWLAICFKRKDCCCYESHWEHHSALHVWRGY